MLWVANFGGLKWNYKFEHSQESETGQIVVDLSRHAGLINMGLQWIEDHEFLIRVVYGDKDIFRFVFLIMGKSFHVVPMIPGVSLNHENKKDSLVHYWPLSSSSSSTSSGLSHAARGSSNEGSRAYNYQPMFFHQLKLRQANAFLHMENIPRSTNAQPSACFYSATDGFYANETEANHYIRKYDLNNPENPRLPKLIRSDVQQGEELMKFAQYVFDTTDKVRV